jgi:hypothetical protein
VNRGLNYRAPLSEPFPNRLAQPLKIDPHALIVPAFGVGTRGQENGPQAIVAKQKFDKNSHPNV